MEPFSVSGTKGALAEGVKESRGDVPRGVRVGGWRVTLSSPVIPLKRLSSGARGVDGMLSSGAGWDMGEGGGTRDGPRATPREPIRYKACNAHARSGSHQECWAIDLRSPIPIGETEFPLTITAINKLSEVQARCATLGPA